MQLLFNNILGKALTRKASDIHFIPSDKEVILKFRINDQFIFIETIHQTLYQKLLTFMKYQAGLDVANHNTAQSGRYLYKFKQLYYLRISTLPLSLGNESCVIRIIPQFFSEPKRSSELLDLYASVKKGFGCSEIFAILKFPKSIIMLVYFSEIFGDLTLYLNNVEDFLLRNYKIKLNFYKTVQYPLVLLSFFIIMIMILNYTIIPEFKSLYLNMGVELSVLQIILTSIIFNLPLILLLIVIIISLIVILSICYYRSCSVAKKIQFIRKLPILRKLFIRYKTYRLATEFSLFYKNGISLQSIVEIYANQESDPYLNYLSNIINLGLQKGLNLSDVLKETGCFEPGLIKFIKAGEKEGKLEIELKTIQ
ncbi:DNA transport machinery protein [Staphylococcus gallinarum]|uniref:DNA transport machinery protein n=1 Tax=Staphylococcus gallinarum TaxID=1293 RepID=A0A380FI00_STAGA|nr:DNA transport machinery protein [Staphylococcus gallinarum]